MARLAGHVSLRDATGDVVSFKPGDDVPEWAAKQITNPRLWEDGDVPFPPAPKSLAPVAGDQTDEALRAEVERLQAENLQLHSDKQQLIEEVNRLRGTTPGADGAPEPPPRGGAGGGRDAWAEYASHFTDKVTITEDDKRDEIIDKLEKAGVRVE